MVCQRHAAKFGAFRMVSLLMMCAGTMFMMPVRANAQEGAAVNAAGKPAAAAASIGTALPIRAITMYRSGVASIQRRGEVMGTAMIPLRFRTEQVNDILKSMVVLDLSGAGRVDGVSYASRDPLVRRLASFGVDISDDPQVSVLLSRLRGAEVAVGTSEGEVVGTILNCESRAVVRPPATTPVTTMFVNLITAQGIRSLDLGLVTSVQVKDEKLAAELNRALAAVAEHRADRTKTVDVSLSGPGSREILIAYVQEAPVWKTSYRLVLPEHTENTSDDVAIGVKEGKAMMQGWAIVENTTDDDWNNVELGLVSGQPVSFRMDLYQPLYAYRPEMPVPTVPGAVPRVYEGGVQLATPMATADALAVPRSVAPASKAGAPGASTSGGQSRFRERGEQGGYIAEFSAALSSEEYAAASGVSSGEVFEYKLDHPVTIERQRSAMLPIISSNLGAKRLSVYTSGGSKHPMRGVQLTNDTELEMLPGPISVFDGSAYAGDAQIGFVRPGEKRLLTYSMDLDLSVDVKTQESRNVQMISIGQGMIRLKVLSNYQITYTVSSTDQKQDRAVMIENDEMEGWELKGNVKPVETTPQMQRFMIDVPSGKQAKLVLPFERTEIDNLSLQSTNIADLLAYRTNGASISEKVLESIRKAQAMFAVVNEHAKTIERLESERKQIVDDQQRLRQNLSAVERTSELYSRYIKKLTEQETRLEAIVTESAKATIDKAEAQRQLDAYLKQLDVE